MKQFFRYFVFFISAIMSLTSCSKSDEVDPNLRIDDKQEHVYTFAIGRSAETKAILASDSKGKFGQWEEGDKLGSITTNTSGYSSITPASGGNPATFSIYSKGGLSAGNTITVWYPYGGTTQSDATSVSLSIPANQTHLESGDFDYDAMPMVTKQIIVTAEMVSTTNQTPLSTINLANLGSVINFKVFSTKAEYATEKVKSITFNAKNQTGTEDANIGGSFLKNLATIDPASEETMTISSFTSGVTSIRTTPYADAAIGSNKASALDLYMVVAPGSYMGTIVVKTDAAEYTYTLSSAKTFVRSGIKAFGLDLNSSNVSRETVVDYVTLDWNYPGGTAADLNAVAGVTTSLGDNYSDYAESHAPYRVKFGHTGDYIQVRANTEIETVSVGYKKIGGADISYLKIFESADGTNWSSVENLAVTGAQNDIGTLTTTNPFNSSSRFVKIEFEKEKNIGIGPISILKPTNWVLSSISVATPPSVTEYLVGESFDPTGMVVMANYVDEDNNTNVKSEPITGYTYSPTTELSVSNTAITISYTEGEVTKTTTQAITVKASATEGATWSYTFNSQIWNATGTQTIGDKSWTMAGTGGPYFGYDATKGQQFGSKNNPYSALTLTSNFGAVYGVREIRVSTSGTSEINATLSVSVGGTSFLCESATNVAITDANTIYSFVTPDNNLKTGDIVLSYSNSSSKGIYVKKIVVNPVAATKLTMTDISCTAHTSSSLTFGWAAVSGAIGYKVSTDGGLTYGDLQTALSYKWTGLTPNTEYRLWVKAIGDGEEYSTSDPKQSAVGTTDAASTDKTYTITWNSANNSASINTYTDSWSVTVDDFTCNMVNWNNNRNGWNYVKAGRKNYASVATITTDGPVGEAIKTVTLTIDAVTAEKINSLKLYVSSSSDFSSSTSYSFSVGTGDKSVTISSPAVNCYYKIEADCASGTSNGLITVSKLVLSTN